jgi:hypothetical protein
LVSDIPAGDGKTVNLFYSARDLPLTSSFEVESHFLRSLSGLGILEVSPPLEGVLRPESGSCLEAASGVPARRNNT